MKCRVSVTLLGVSFLQSFDRQQIQNLKVIMQSRIKRNMTNPACIMVLNQDYKPEGKQVYRTNDWRSLAEICHNQWRCSQPFSNHNHTNSAEHLYLYKLYNICLPPTCSFPYLNVSCSPALNRNASGLILVCKDFKKRPL